VHKSNLIAALDKQLGEDMNDILLDDLSTIYKYEKSLNGSIDEAIKKREILERV
jgi:hypothetical protein